MHELLKFPDPTTFGRIIGLTNRPLSRDISNLPEDGRIELYSHLNLLNRQATLAQLRAIPGIEATTHVFFAAYTGHGASYADLRAYNEEILVSALGAVELCCPHLKFWTLQTGGKAYGVEFKDQVPYNPPLKETMPRIPEPHAQNVFYYSQYDIMTNASAGKSWSFCEIRPDAIVGFVPQNNAMNIAQALGLFLSLWKEVEKEGDEVRTVPFPGSRAAYEALHTDTSQDILARFHIYAAGHTDLVAGKAFNVADGPATTWRQVWPEVCAWFGLKGGEPEDRAFSAQEWMESHQSTWAEWVQRNGLKQGALEGTSWKFMQDVISIPFRRDYDLSASREIGFTEERPHAQGYFKTFEEMRKARIIP